MIEFDPDVFDVSDFMTSAQAVSVAPNVISGHPPSVKTNPPASRVVTSDGFSRGFKKKGMR